MSSTGPLHTSSKGVSKKRRTPSQYAPFSFVLPADGFASYTPVDKDKLNGLSSKAASLLRKKIAAEKPKALQWIGPDGHIHLAIEFDTPLTYFKKKDRPDEMLELENMCKHIDTTIILALLGCKVPKNSYGGCRVGNHFVIGPKTLRTTEKLQSLVDKVTKNLSVPETPAPVVPDHSAPLESFPRAQPPTASYPSLFAGPNQYQNMAMYLQQQMAYFPNVFLPYEYFGPDPLPEPYSGVPTQGYVATTGPMYQSDSSLKLLSAEDLAKLSKPIQPKYEPLVTPVERRVQVNYASVNNTTNAAPGLPPTNTAADNLLLNNIDDIFDCALMEGSGMDEESSSRHDFGNNVDEVNWFY